MVVIVQETAPIRAIRHIPEEPQNSSQDTQRWRLNQRVHTWRPPTDVFETEAALVVRVEVAGMREEDFSIMLENRILSIRGVRSDAAERRAYHQMEIPFGEFSTEVEIFINLNTSQIEAVYSEGFLKIVIPKARPHQVPIESGE